MAIQLILTFQKEKKAFNDCFRQPAGWSLGIGDFSVYYKEFSTSTFGSLWLVFPASRILHENLEPGGPSSFFLLPVLEFHASSLPQKRMLPLKKKWEKENAWLQVITMPQLLSNAFLAAQTLLTQSLVSYMYLVRVISIPISFFW